MEPYGRSMFYMNFGTKDDYLDITKLIPDESIDTRDSRKKWATYSMNNNNDQKKT